MLIEEIKNTFKTAFNEEPQMVVRSSGRINLIGEHTDYNGGFVLPAAIDKSVYFAVSARNDNECHFIAHDLNEKFTTRLDNLVKTETQTWANYLMGVLKVISDFGISDFGSAHSEIRNPTSEIRGINLVFGSNLPSGGGMSSSAAIENGIGFAVNELFDLGLSRLDLVRISQQAENNFVGMKCGIMDMFASMMGIENQFVRIDCRDLSYQYFPFDAPDLRLVLCDTTVKHALVDSEYNTRREECEEGVKILQQFDPSVKTLRDVSLDVLKAYKNDLKPIVYQRCEYIVEEIERVEKACVALQKKDFKTVGALMFETHDGLNEKYNVSCPELNFLAEKARNTEGVLGARMMGGGFGGCTLNLVKADRVEAFVEDLSRAYQRVFSKKMLHYVVKPSNGTEVVSADNVIFSLVNN
jgi:galactokinase